MSTDATGTTAGDAGEAALTLDAVRDAREAIAARIHRTPLFSSRALASRIGARDAFIKAELFQRTGSFKVRGALNRVRTLSPEERARGLITVSAGNHAQGVAFAAAAFGAHAVVVMPENAPRSKVEASRGYGAEIVLHGTVNDALERSLELKREHGYTYVHPYDDPAVMAGQGTVGLEVLEDLEGDVDVVVVPVGGGGLLGGIATVAAALRPDARVIGVEPTGAAGLARALEAGRVVRLDRVDTIADGLTAPETGKLVLDIATRLLHDLVLVTDDEIAEAMRFLLERAKLPAEPAGAAATAALLAGKVDVGPGDRVVTLASGGNVDVARLGRIIGG